MSAHFDLASNAGIADVVAGERTLDDALVNELGTRNLSLLPAGASSGNAGEIIISERMRDLVSLLREQFQFVVIDSPPILPYADSRALAKTSDGVILVGRYALTTREALNCAAQLLAEARVPILGVVLNGVDLNAPDYRYYGYADVERSYQRRPYQGS